MSYLHPTSYTNPLAYGESSSGYPSTAYPHSGYASQDYSLLSTTSMSPYSSHPMRHDASQGSHSSESSGNSSNNYGSSYSTSPTAYSPSETVSFSTQTGYYPSSGSRSQYPPLAPTASLAPPQQFKPMPQTKKSSKPTPYMCLYSNCGRSFNRSFDLDRHSKTHFPHLPKHDCPKGGPGGFCGRVADKGFSRLDHLNEHLRKVHLVDIPKSARGNRSPS